MPRYEIPAYVTVEADTALIAREVAEDSVIEGGKSDGTGRVLYLSIEDGNPIEIEED